MIPGWTDRHRHRHRHRHRRLRTPVAIAVALGLPLFGGCFAGGDDPPIPERPTFASHVGEIVYGKCTSCHRDGGVAPFPFESYEQVAARADLIARVTASRRMPPWLPEPTDFAFADELRLTDREIEILRRWVENGAPLGDSVAVPRPPPAATDWVLGEPGLVVEMPEAYVLGGGDHPGGHRDVFRNFVLPVPLEETRYVRAVELQGEGVAAVHHATMGMDATAGSRREDSRDPEPGFDGLHSSSRMRQPAGFMLGWTPGATPRWNPDDLTWALEPGVDFVIQTHLMAPQDPTEVRLRVGFHFGNRPATTTGLVKNLYLLGRTIDIPAGDSAYVVEDDFTLPVDAELLGLHPHAHYLARSMEVRAHLPGGEIRTLLRIPKWDFDWQQVYHFASPARLPSGTVLRMRFVYDNSAANPANPNDPPARVTYGLNSSDEMAELWIQARPQGAADLAPFQVAVDRKRTEDYLELFAHSVHVHPTDPRGHADLAAVLASTGRVDEAIGHYREALELEPVLADTHYELGLLLDASGEPTEAERHLSTAVDVDPEHTSAQAALGGLLLRQGRPDDARAHGLRATESDPRDPSGYLLLGNVARAEGNVSEAIGHYRRAAAVAPTNPGLQFDLANNLILAGRAGEAVEHLRRGAELAPEDLSPRLAAAWVLASHPDEGIRSPQHALEIGAELQQLLGDDHPVALDLIAAAHAASGRFDRATEVGREALAQASASAQAELAVRIRQRVALYEHDRPFLDLTGPYSAAR